MALYDRIGSGYDTTRRADPSIVGRLIGHLDLEAGARCLDLGCGTGNYTSAVAATGLRVCGVDPSRRMLEAARHKGESVAWVYGVAEALPFRDASFSGALCTLAIHHFRSLRSAFSEVLRVLRSGRLVVFTSTPEQMRGYWLNEYFPEAMAASIRQMPELDVVDGALRAAGFRVIRTDPYEVPPDLRDLFLYSGKHRPDMYLDPRVRAGISTFAVLADPAEVASGYQRLAGDIRSGRIAEVTDAYRHGRGDYLFVIAEA